MELLDKKKKNRLLPYRGSKNFRPLLALDLDEFQRQQRKGEGLQIIAAPFSHRSFLVLIGPPFKEVPEI